MNGTGPRGGADPVSKGIGGCWNGVIGMSWSSMVKRIVDGGRVGAGVDVGIGRTRRGQERGGEVK